MKRKTRMSGLAMRMPMNISPSPMLMTAANHTASEA
jgi:hypothetical protein